MAADTYQRFATRIKAVAQDGSEVVLPVDTLNARPVPYVPEGSTQKELYDDRVTYRNPTWSVMVTVEYAYERTEYRPVAYDTVLDLIQLFDSGNQPVDLLIKYDDSTGSYESSGASQGAVAPYRVPDVVPEITEDVAGIEFENQARQKERTIEFRTADTNYTLSDIDFLFD